MVNWIKQAWPAIIMDLWWLFQWLPRYHWFQHWYCCWLWHGDVVKQHQLHHRAKMMPHTTIPAIKLNYSNKKQWVSEHHPPLQLSICELWTLNDFSLSLSIFSQICYLHANPFQWEAQAKTYTNFNLFCSNFQTYKKKGKRTDWMLKIEENKWRNEWKNEYEEEKRK